jgi:hypothetical protein
MEQIRDDRACENFVYALPWGWIAAGQEWQGKPLQLCVAGNLPGLLCKVPILRHERKVHEQGDAHAVRRERP